MSSSGAIRAGRAYVEMFLDGKKAEAGLNAFAAKMKTFGRSITLIGRTVALGGAAMTAPFLGALKIFDTAGQHIREFARDAQDIGVPIPASDLAAAREFAASLHTLSVLAKGAAVAVGAALAPALKDSLTWAKKELVVVADWVRNHQGLVQIAFKAATVVAGLGVAMLALGKAMSVMGALAKVSTLVLPLLASALGFVLSPVGLIVVALGAAAAGFLLFTKAGQSVTGAIGEKLSGLVDSFKTSWTGIQAAMEAGDLELAAKIAWAGVKLAFMEATASLRKWWIGFTAGLSEGWVLLKQIASDTWDGIKSTFATAVDAMLGIFETFTNSIFHAFDWAVQKISGLLKPLIETAIKLHLPWAKEAMDAVKAVDEAAGKHVADIHLGRLSQPGPDLNTVAGRQAEIHRLGQQNKEFDAIKDKEAEALRGVDEGLAALRANRDDLLGQAAAKKAAGQVMPVDVLRDKADVKGSFSAFAANAMGSDKMNEVALNTKASADALKDIKKKMDNNGGKFS